MNDLHVLRYAARIVKAGFELKATESVPCEIKESVFLMTKRLYPDFARISATGGFIHGWQGFERVYENRGGRWQVEQLKPLLHSITTIRVDAENGNFAGLENRDAWLDEGSGDGVLVSFNVEGTNWLGKPLLAEELSKPCPNLVTDRAKTICLAFNKVIRDYVLRNFGEPWSDSIWIEPGVFDEFSSSTLEQRRQARREAEQARLDMAAGKKAMRAAESTWDTMFEQLAIDFHQLGIATTDDEAIAIAEDAADCLEAIAEVIRTTGNGMLEKARFDEVFNIWKSRIETTDGTSISCQRAFGRSDLPVFFDVFELLILAITKHDLELRDEVLACRKDGCEIARSGVFGASLELTGRKNQFEDKFRNAVAPKSIAVAKPVDGPPNTDVLSEEPKPIPPGPKRTDEEAANDKLIADLWEVYAMKLKKQGKRAYRSRAAKLWTDERNDVGFLSEGLPDASDYDAMAKRIELACKRHKRSSKNG